MMCISMFQVFCSNSIVCVGHVSPGTVDGTVAVPSYMVKIPCEVYAELTGEVLFYIVYGGVSVMFIISFFRSSGG